MAQFKGSNSKVRCIDCLNLEDTRCAAKDAQVAPKKRRVCSVYKFKGEYENRNPAEVLHLPTMDRKTRKMIERLIKMGVVPVSEDGTVETREGFARTKQLPMPQSTATAAIVGTRQQDDPLVYKTSETEIADPNLIWTRSNETESDDNRG